MANLAEIPATRAAPINLAAPDTSPAAIEAAVAYGLTSYKCALDSVAYTPARLSGAQVLEIGPGVNYAVAIGLSSSAASVTVADRWLPVWREDYHPAVYRGIANALAAEAREAEARAFYDAASAKHGGVVELERPAEALGLAEASIDLVLSNAVLEHLYDADAAIAEFARITKRGGWNLHQVDYRDHRDFSRPLEYLTLTTEEFRTLAEAEDYGFGCQLRAADHAAMFARHGFRVFGIYPNAYADDAYLADVTPRLATKINPEDLRITGALLLCERI